MIGAAVTSMSTWPSAGAGSGRAPGTGAVPYAVTTAARTRRPSQVAMSG